MKLYIANPMYDAVFKYLMEDERIARTLISALLKKKVVHLERRAPEHVNTTRNDISMFRIDYRATIREEDGHEHLVLIVLQKTWLETETLRFRQYLGAQYNLKENIVGTGENTDALPIVAVYILGHLVDDIHVPVVYVNHKAYDYDGNLLETQKPSPFVDSQTHNSIIVQIPLLHGQVNNRLEQLLSIFDQTHVTKNNQQIIELDDDGYAGDAEMEYVVKRLLSAATNPNVRQDMNVEEEIFKAIEDRDTAIMVRDKALQEIDQALAEKDKVLNEKDKLLSNAIKGMLEKGMDLTTVSSILGLTEVEVKKLLETKPINY